MFDVVLQVVIIALVINFIYIWCIWVFRRFFNRKNISSTSNELTIKTNNNVITIGDSIEYDIVNNVINFKKPVTINSTENIMVKSEKHIIINSGRDYDPVSKTPKSVWINSELDDSGHPFGYEYFVDRNGYPVLIKAEYDDAGELKIPEGYTHISETNLDDCDKHN